MTEEIKPQPQKYEIAVARAHQAFVQILDEPTWNKEKMFAIQAVRNNDLLKKCDEASITAAIVNLALTGSTLNPARALAYLVPRGGKCVLDISYRGMAGIAMDSGSVKHIAPRIVYTFDEFKYYEQDGEPHITHVKNFNPPHEFTAGPEKFWDFLVCGYVVATLHDGSKIITEPLPKWKLEKAMKTSKTTSGQTPWRTFPDEMVLKTLVKHAYKLLPQTERMSNAIAIVNEHEGLAGKETHVNTFMNTFAKEEPVDAEFTETAPPESAPETATGADIPVSLPMVYRMLADLCKLTGDNPDDKISELSGGSFPMQQDLEQASQKQLKVIRAKLDAALAVAAMD